MALINISEHVYWELVPLQGTPQWRSYVRNACRVGFPVILFVQVFQNGRSSSHVHEEAEGVHKREGDEEGEPTKGLPEVVDCAVEDHDRETWNSKVKAGTRDTRFIQIQAVKVVNPTSCLGYQVWRPALGVGLFRCSARYSSLLYIVQGAGS
jgi:hypothetical protein